VPPLQSLRPKLRFWERNCGTRHRRLQRRRPSAKIARCPGTNDRERIGRIRRFWGFALDGSRSTGQGVAKRGWGPEPPAGQRSGAIGAETSRERTRWADGRPASLPANTVRGRQPGFPLGNFAEDYDTVRARAISTHRMDASRVTPDLPGTYAYFLTTDDAQQLGLSVLPWPSVFRGKLPGVGSAGDPNRERVQFTHTALETGKPAELRLCVSRCASAEIVHEQPVHLMVVSSDLARIRTHSSRVGSSATGTR